MSAGAALSHRVPRSPSGVAGGGSPPFAGPVHPSVRDRARRRVPQARLLLLPPVDPPAVTVPDAPPLHRAPDASSVRSPLTDALWTPRTTPAPEPMELPDPGDLARAIVLTTVEVLAGTRPLSQLVRWLTPELYEHLADARAAQGPPTGTVRRASARRATVCRLSDQVAEATVVVHDGRKVRAAAIRLEVHRRRWRATVLEIY